MGSDAAWEIYAIITAYGLLAATIAIRAPALGLALWMGAYPLFTNLIVPPGMEQLPPTRLGTLVLLLAFLPRISWTAMKPTIGSFAIYAAFLLFGLLSSVLSPIGLKAVARTVSYLEPMIWLTLGATAVMGSAPKRGRTILVGIVAGFVCVLIFAIPELVLQKNPLLVAGLSRNDSDFMADTRLGFTGRLVSTLGQPVYAGLYGVVAVASAILLARQTTKSRERFLFSLIAVAGAGFVFLTGTRAALGGLAILLIALLLLSGRRGAAKFVPVFAAIALALYSLMPRSISEYWAESVSLEEPASSNANVLGRIALTKAMVDVFRAHMLLGIGPGFFQKSESGEPGLSTEGLAGVENQYATLLAENGVMGTCLFVTWLVSLVVALARSRSRWWSCGSFTEGRWAACTVSAIAIMAVSCFVLTTLPMLQAAGMAGVALGCSPRDRSGPTP